jgi:hypothetical protein
MADWQPIATAPKDGTVLLGWIVAPQEPWSDGFEAPALIHWEPAFKSSICDRKAGWVAQWRGEPTHWQPLPPAPGAGLAQSKQEPADLRSKRSWQFNDGWQFFVCYLIDHCEGEVVSEEMLGRTAAAFLRDPKYGAAAVSQSKQATPPEAAIPPGYRLVSLKKLGALAGWIKAEWHPDEMPRALGMIQRNFEALRNDTGTPPNAPPNASGCDFCRNPLFVGTKCKNCGRNAPPNSEGTASSTRQAPVKQADCKCPQGMYCRHRARIEGNSEGTGTNGGQEVDRG